MKTVASWFALLRREYLEHRLAFVWFPLGILGLIALAAVSAFGFNRIREIELPTLATGLKIFELGYLGLAMVWFFYLAVTLLFYFSDAFAADRRNNAMLFWKSMPVSDLRILASKSLAAFTVFPLIIMFIAAISGLLLFLMVSVAATVLPALIMPAPADALWSFLNITIFMLGYVALALLWYAPFLAWVGGLATIFGRWSLPLSLVIPGLLAVIENVAFFGNVPTGGYIWSVLRERWQFGLNELDTGQIIMQVRSFDGPFFIGRLVWGINWPSLYLGLGFAGLVILLASAWRRRHLN